MDFQNVKINEVGSITTGLVIKRKEAELSLDTAKSYKMLTLKSFEADGQLNTKELDVFQSTEKLDDKYLTRKGDVIIRLSHPHTAIAIGKEQEGYLIPSLFVVIRLDVDYLDPEYLSIYLNSENMRRFYAKRAVGSAIQIIKTSMLKEIIVSFPEMKKQKEIVEFNRLIIREKALLSSLIEEKTKYNKEIISSLITGGFSNGN